VNGVEVRKWEKGEASGLAKHGDALLGVPWWVSRCVCMQRPAGSVKPRAWWLWSWGAGRGRRRRASTARDGGPSPAPHAKGPASSRVTWIAGQCTVLPPCGGVRTLACLIPHGSLWAAKVEHSQA